MQNNKPQRLNFFNGRLLSVADLRLEQNYHINKRRLHNRHLHGWGVVEGLDVNAKGNKVIVAPGFAIDCAGNEIVLDSSVDIIIAQGAHEFFVAVEYAESEIDPIPALDGDDDPVRYAHIQEEAKVYLMDANPNMKHEKYAAGSSGCGKPHPIAIAHLHQAGKGWKIMRCGLRGG